MLRSSSTPLFGSMLSHTSESHIHGGIQSLDNTESALHKYMNLNQVHYYNRYHPRCLAAVSGNSSPISPSMADFSDHGEKGFRRAQSESNLGALAASFCPYCGEKEPHRCSDLESSPEKDYEEEDKESGDASEHRHGNVLSQGNYLIVENVKESGQNRMEAFLDVGLDTRNLLVEREFHTNGSFDNGAVINNGFGGTSGGGNGGGDSFFPRFSGGDGDEIDQTEQHYRRLLEDDPSNPLILKNYAEFLFQTKGDVRKAEEYCCRAMLADPEIDGDTLALYAQLSWMLHHDLRTSTYYFNRAAKASPESSHVHAAYARFLWEVEDEDGEDEDESCARHHFLPSCFHGTIASTNT